MQTLVKMEGITKEFPGVKALDNISLEINAGEVHVLLGENGAGKSTLMKILSGVYTPTSGKITVKGKEYSKLTPQDSYDLGISIIYQELSVINELSILENLFVGKLPTKKAGIIPVVDYDKMREIAADVLGKVGVHRDPNLFVEKISISEKQQVEIAKALASKADVIIMDEPTTSLTTLVLSNSRSVYGFPVSFTSLMSGSIVGIPIPVIIALIAAVILWFVTTKCKVGRNIYALGGNIDAAWYSGINVNLHRLIVFMISGTCAGLAGVVLLGRVGAAEPAAATGFETFAIAASIIGGTSFMGGKGKIPGVVVGGLIIGLINYGMTALTLPSTYQQIVMGALIIIAVTIDTVVGRKS